MTTIKVGDRVRSFDFAMGGFGRDLSGERAAFVEGTVVAIGDHLGLGYNQYHIKVDFDIIGDGVRVGTMVYPPVNGTPSWDGVTDFVEKLPTRTSLVTG
jgi:hypothetical protein